MPDLTTEVAGVALRNPLVASACGLTRSLDFVVALAEAGIGAVTTKTISVYPLGGTETLYLESDYQTIAADPRLLLDDGVKLIKEAKKRVDVPIIANIIGHSDHVQEWTQVAQAVEAAGADIVEVDLNCHTPDKPGPPDKWRRFGDQGSVGADPDLTRAVLEIVRAAVDVPVSTKICPSTMDLLGQAQAALDGGSDALSLLNATDGLPGLDIYNGGRSLYPGLETLHANALVGDPANPFALYMTAVFGVAFDGTPMISGGGVMKWERAVERLMAGAKAVGMAALLYRDGPEAIPTMLKGIESYMEDQGYENLAAIPRADRDSIRVVDWWKHPSHETTPA